MGFKLKNSVYSSPLMSFAAQYRNPSCSCNTERLQEEADYGDEADEQVPLYIAFCASCLQQTDVGSWVGRLDLLTGTCIRTGVTVENVDVRRTRREIVCGQVMSSYLRRPKEPARVPPWVVFCKGLEA